MLINLAGAVWLGVLATALLIGRRQRCAVPVLLLAGGALTVGFEPIVDTLATTVTSRSTSGASRCGGRS